MILSLQAAVLTYITGGLYSQAVKCLMAADMVDTALRLLSFLYKHQLDLELDSATSQQLLSEATKVMSEINYKEGLDNICERLAGKANVMEGEVK